MKAYTPLIILALIAAGVGYYIYMQRQKAAVPTGGTTINATVITERGGVTTPTTGQTAVKSRATGYALA